MDDEQQAEEMGDFGDSGKPLAGMAMLLLFRSIPIAAGTASAVIIGIILLKHLALAILVGSPLTAAFQSIRPIIRPWCPFAKP